MMPYPFHANIANIRPPRDNYYGCDPYNTVDAPAMRLRIKRTPKWRDPLDAWAQIGQLMFGGKRT